jgi:uncharacterized protein YhfF
MGDSVRMPNELKPATAEFWDRYLESVADASHAQRWLYDAFRVGPTDDSAEDGALLIVRGLKTATASLLWSYEASHRPRPQVGSLHVVENARDQPVCVIRTTELIIRPFREVDQRFAYDFGEWDRSLKMWRQECWQLFAATCTQLGRDPDHAMPILCQRFRVLNSESSSTLLP